MIHSWPITSKDEWLHRRMENVNASEVGALFGKISGHPKLTPLKLWALKGERVHDHVAEKEAERGKRFEPVVVDLLRDDHPDWNLESAHHYYWDPEWRLGATPDVLGTRPDISGRGIVQVKTVGQYAWMRHWHTHDRQIKVPLWIAVQASVEAYLTGSTWAGVAALRLGDGGIDLLYVDIPLKMPVIRKIEDLVAEFWRRVERNEPYDPDLPRDTKLVMDLWEPDGPQADFSTDKIFAGWVADRRELMKTEREGHKAAERRKQVDARIVHRMGNASRALVPGGEVTVKMISKQPYKVNAQHYPLVRVREVGR